MRPHVSIRPLPEQEARMRRRINEWALTVAQVEHLLDLTSEIVGHDIMCSEENRRGIDRAHAVIEATSGLLRNLSAIMNYDEGGNDGDD